MCSPAESTSMSGKRVEPTSTASSSNSVARPPDSIKIYETRKKKDTHKRDNVSMAQTIEENIIFLLWHFQLTHDGPDMMKRSFSLSLSLFLLSCAQSAVESDTM